MKQSGWLISALCIIIFFFSAGEAWAQNARQAAGLALARQICSECHAVEQRRGASPNPFAPRFDTIANVPGMTAMALSVALQRSHPTMPNVNLNSGELTQLVAYILSLQRAN